jgi:hypothetical protein
MAAAANGAAAFAILFHAILIVLLPFVTASLELASGGERQVRLRAVALSS